MEIPLTMPLRRFEGPTSNCSDAAMRHRVARRVLYAVNHSYPISSNGYAVRTHGVALGLRQSGCDVVVASRSAVDRDGVKISHIQDGVRYVHTRFPCNSTVSLEPYPEHSVESLVELIGVFKPEVVMAASNWQNALPAGRAALQCGLRFFYEVRGFWELSRAAHDPDWESSEAFCRDVALETAVAKMAHKVFTLNRFMATELVRRGVAQDKVSLVPNGFEGWPAPPSVPLPRTGLNITTRYVVGYVGSFNVYEGHEELIQALALVRQRGVDVSLLLVGSGESSGFSTVSACKVTTAYREYAQKLCVSKFLFMPGRVAPELTASYYAMLDVVVIPRRPLAVCELVSPMKPLEAASFGKRVLMSDVAPLAELKGLCPSFSYFKKGSVQSLADKLVDLLTELAPPLPRCSALDMLTWDTNVASIVSAVKEAERDRTCT